MNVIDFKFYLTYIIKVLLNIVTAATLMRNYSITFFKRIKIIIAKK